MKKAKYGVIKTNIIGYQIIIQQELNLLARVVFKQYFDLFQIAATRHYLGLLIECVLK